MVKDKKIIEELKKLGKPLACSVPRPEITVEDYMKREKPKVMEDYGMNLSKI